MRHLILITNDDGYKAKGLQHLALVANQYADVVVMAPMTNASGKGLSLTSDRPLQVTRIREEKGLTMYACDGTPVDCLKLGIEHFCPRRPDLVLSGINHGSNASVNVLYSGTMGAAIEAALNGYKAIGFSLLSHDADPDFTCCNPCLNHIISDSLCEEFPAGIALNVNIPYMDVMQVKGIRVCRAAAGRWVDSFERRTDPDGRPCWCLTGKFECHDNGTDTDLYALDHGYVSIVPVSVDNTNTALLDPLKKHYNTNHQH